LYQQALNLVSQIRLLREYPLKSLPTKCISIHGRLSTGDIARKHEGGFCKRLLKQEDSTLNCQFEDFAGFYGFKPVL
jgi:hypothetical protein